MQAQNIRLEEMLAREKAFHEKKILAMEQEAELLEAKDDAE
jgi:hypothetical protein